MERRKLVALMMGDRYGVGPELVARLVHGLHEAEDGAGAVLVGDRAVFERGRAVVGAARPYATAPDLAAAKRSGAPFVFVERSFDAPLLPLGRVSVDAGHEVLETLGFLLDAAAEGTIDAIVYAPLNKQAMKLAGHAAGDELDFAVRRLGVAGATGEINILGDLWTSRVTSHVPLRAVGDLITEARVGAAIDLIAGALMRSGRARPRLAVAALNPHAGEGGAFGMEEIEVISPAIAAAKARGVDVAGPFPSDTVFPRAMDGHFDAVVTMYHDQGQIALKLAGLGQGVTCLAGLPVPVATPGHGTAFDIAGTGRARVDGLEAAFALVRRMAAEGTATGA